MIGGRRTVVRGRPPQATQPRGRIPCKLSRAASRRLRPRESRMPSVPTVTGPVEASALGFTLMHEHVFTRSPGVFEAWPHLWDREAEVQRAVATLRELKSNGVDTIVDLTTVDLGRDVDMVREVARQTDLNIVMCTGVWRYPPRYFQNGRPDPIADLFVKDIEEGMNGGEVRAAIIKLATEPEVDDLNRT